MAGVNGAFYVPDLDGDMRGGLASERLLWLIEHYPSWGELSVSTTGAASSTVALSRGRKPTESHGRNLELFGSSGFIAMTGVSLNTSITGLADGSGLLATILREGQEDDGKPEPGRANDNRGNEGWDPPTPEKVAAALKFVPRADDHDQWIRIGQAVHDWDSSEVGFNLWCQWARTSDKYDAADSRKRWKSFTPGAGRGIGTVFRLAMDNGWQPGPRVKMTGTGNTTDNDGKQEQSGGGQAKADPENPLITGAMDNAAFNAADHRHEWLIDGLLVADEPLVVSGPSKAMKTAVLVDAAVSLAAGSPFLGRFAVRKPAPVYVVSAESGAASLQARMRHVCKAKGIDPDGLPIPWYTRVELLSTVEGCRNLGAALKHFGSRVVVLDPSYLLLGGDTTTDNAGNMFAMGGAPGQRRGRLPGRRGDVRRCHPRERQAAGRRADGVVPYRVVRLSAVGPAVVAHQPAGEVPGRRQARPVLPVRRECRSHRAARGRDRRGGLRPARRQQEMGGQRPGRPGGGQAEAEEDAADELRQLQADCDQVLAAMTALLVGETTVATRNALKTETGLSLTRIANAVKKLVGDGAIVETAGEVQCGHHKKPARGIRRPESWTP